MAVRPMTQAGPKGSFLDPEDAETILVHKYKSFRKNFIIRGTRPLIGDGLLLSEGEF